MKQVSKDVYYNALMSEKRDVIHGDCIHHEPGKFYPYTQEMKFKHLPGLFGKTKLYGYVNGQPKEEYYLNN